MRQAGKEDRTTKKYREGSIYKDIDYRWGIMVHGLGRVDTRWRTHNQSFRAISPLVISSNLIHASQGGDGVTVEQTSNILCTSF